MRAYNEIHFISADMTAEELFSMFFGGGGFPSQSNVFMRHHNARRYRQTEEDNSQVRERRVIIFVESFLDSKSIVGQQHGQANGAAVFIQLLPVLLLIVLSMLSSLFISDPVYSLQPNS